MGGKKGVNKSNWKGTPKGKGKGPGKGQVPGMCYLCWEWGHSQKYCPHVDTSHIASKKGKGWNKGGFPAQSVEETQESNHQGREILENRSNRWIRTSVETPTAGTPKTTQTTGATRHTHKHTCPKARTTHTTRAHLHDPHDPHTHTPSRSPSGTGLAPCTMRSRCAS